MALDPNQWTHKTQEAFAAALEHGQGEQQPRGHARPPARALLRQDEGVVLPILQKLGLAPLMLRNRADEAVADCRRRTAASRASAASCIRCSSAPTTSARSCTTSTCRPSTCCSPWPTGSASRREELLAALRDVRGIAPGHEPEPRGAVPGAREVRPRPHRGGAPGQARPGHRARRGDPPRHPGAVAAHQEQPGADRRARRRQDRDRRGPRPSHRRGRRARRA